MPLRRGQEVDRVQDGQRLGVFLRAEVEAHHAGDDFLFECFRIQLAGLDVAARNRTVGFDGQLQHELAFQEGVLAAGLPL